MRKHGHPMVNLHVSTKARGHDRTTPALRVWGSEREVFFWVIHLRK